MRFGRRGKLSPRYIATFEILWTVGEVAYELALPPAFSAIHLVLHVSILRRYVPDESHVLQYEAVELDDRLTSCHSSERCEEIALESHSCC